ncbi:rCG60377 [Rattus norvegicus]|uniref:RCG60377 n=1 Tax=Rattus norvegicus TaxID=10116 RepID=A6KKC1_RAT|nr:rCG60377 [Rattus norvegicus]
MDGRLPMPVRMTAVMSETMLTPVWPPSWSHSECFSCRNSLDPHLRHIKSISLKSLFSR